MSLLSTWDLKQNHIAFGTDDFTHQNADVRNWYQYFPQLVVRQFCEVSHKDYCVDFIRGF